MTRIGVISDTHSHIDEKVKNYLKECDQIWHAGDIGNEQVIDELENIADLKIVYGNIDNHKIRARVAENEIFDVESMKVLITHIAGYPKKYNGRVKKLIHQYRPDVVVAGHSHILKIIYDKELNHLHINPGAIGKSGFHRLRTLVRFSLDNKKISDLQVVEIKR